MSEREIKFRGKVDGVWWYVSPDHNLNLFGQFWHVVDRETVGECSGITDKQKKEIYEGDILHHDDIHHWPKTVRKMTAEKLAKYPLEPIIVEWNESRAGFDPFVSEDDDQGPYFYSERIEIVGNIHDNPELLNRS